MPRRTENRNLSWYCIPRFMAALFTIAKRRKQPKCPERDEWINKMWYVHTAKYFSALKRKEILTHATTWMNLDDIMLSQINQSQKDKYVWFHLYKVPRVAKFTETESRMVLDRGWGEERVGNYCLMGRVSVWMMKKVWEVDGVLAAQQCKCTLNWILKNG